MARAIVLGAASLGLAVALVSPSGLPAAADPPLTVAEAKAQIEQLEIDAAAIDQEYVAVEEQVDRGRAKLKLKQADVKAQTAQVARLKYQVGQVALAHFQNRDLDTAAQLFVTPDTEGFLSQISTVEKVSENQNSALQDYQQQQATLADLQLSAEADLAALSEQEKQLKTLRAASKKKIAESKSVLARLSAEEQRRIADEERRARNAAQRDAEESEESERADETDDDNTPTPVASGSGRGAKALAFARRQLGKPYRYSAYGPDAYDCSGLTGAAWRSVGVSLPRSSSAQYSVGRYVAKSDLQLGDLVFFYRPISHVALYAGNGTILHAPRPGKSVEYTKMSYMPYVGCPPARLTLTVRLLSRAPILALAAAFLLGCSVTSPEPAPTPATSDRLGQARRTLDELEVAILAADRAGFDQLISLRDPTFESRARLLYTNLTTLRVTDLDFLVEPAERSARPGPAAGAGPGRLGASRGGRHPPAGRGRCGRAPGLAHLRDRRWASEAGRDVRRSRRRWPSRNRCGGSARSRRPSKARRPWWPGAGSRQRCGRNSRTGPRRWSARPCRRAWRRTGTAGSASRSRRPSGTSRRCSASRSSGTRGSPP